MGTPANHPLPHRRFAAFEPRSSRPQHNPPAVPAEVEDKIVLLRKTLVKAGYDAGAATIAEQLARDPDVAKVLLYPRFGVS